MALRFIEALNLTVVELHNLSLQHTELQLSLTATYIEANMSALQQSLGLVRADNYKTFHHYKSTFRMTTVQLSIKEFYTTRAAAEQNYFTQLYTLIRNHSSILGEHCSRLFGDAAQSRSMLSRRIDETSNTVRSQGILAN